MFQGMGALQQGHMPVYSVPMVTAHVLSPTVTAVQAAPVQQAQGLKPDCSPSCHILVLLALLMLMLVFLLIKLDCAGFLCCSYNYVHQANVMSYNTNSEFKISADLLGLEIGATTVPQNDTDASTNGIAGKDYEVAESADASNAGVY